MKITEQWVIKLPEIPLPKLPLQQLVDLLQLMQVLLVQPEQLHRQLSVQLLGCSLAN